MLLLSHRNTQHLPDMTACINTAAVTEPITEHLGCIMLIFPHCDIDMWGRVLGGRGRVLTLIKNISLVLIL